MNENVYETVLAQLEEATNLDKTQENFINVSTQFLDNIVSNLLIIYENDIENDIDDIDDIDKKMIEQKIFTNKTTLDFIRESIHDPIIFNIAVVRYYCAVLKLPFNINAMKNWHKFSDKFLKCIMK